MDNLLLSLNLTDTSTLYGGGALLLGAAAALFFIVALFGKRSPAPAKNLSPQARVTGPSSTPTQISQGAPRLEAPEASIIQIDEDDPRMAAAVAEAQKRLPEFSAAFTKARDGYQFSIKAPFNDPGSEESEFMWVHVSRVDFDAVHGTLLNDPEFARTFKYDDVVRVPMDRIVDWVYTDGQNSIGDFTAKVLDEAAKSAPPPPAPYSPETAQNDSSSNST